MAFRMDFKSLPRCRAKARSNFRLPCRQAATKRNGRCHWHGGKVLIKHGNYTKHARFKKMSQQIYMHEMKQALQFVEDMINEQT